MSANISAMTGTNDAPLTDTRAGVLGNSDRIQLRFGNYEIDILENGPAIRVSNLYSVEEGIRTNVIEPTLVNPMHFLSFIGGTTCFYVAAIPFYYDLYI